MFYFCLYVRAFSHLIIQTPFALSPTTKGRLILLANIYFPETNCEAKCRNIVIVVWI